jgi:hypothetical protein
MAFVHDKETILKICEWLGGVPNWTDKDDPEMNEIKTWLITKQARGKIQDRFLEENSIASLIMRPGFTIEFVYYGTEWIKGKEFKDSCHNMAWVNAAAWWVNDVRT